ANAGPADRHAGAPNRHAGAADRHAAPADRDAITARRQALRTTELSWSLTTSVAEADRQARFGPTLAAARAQLEPRVPTLQPHADPLFRKKVAERPQRVAAAHRAGLSRLAAALDELVPATRQRVTAEPAVRLLLELYELLPPES